jgi:hypothetical protein
MKLDQRELSEARAWIKDCVWLDLDSAEDIDDLSDLQIERGIARHFAGGIEEFKNCVQE